MNGGDGQELKQKVDDLKGLSLKIDKNVIVASQNLIFYFPHNKTAQNCKTIGAYTESTDLIFLRHSKKLFIW
jgi:hypothetical protein